MKYEIVYSKRNGSKTKTVIEADSEYQARHVGRQVVNNLQGFGVKLESVNELIK